ncbi:sugar O-acetyltransferase [Litorilituus sediminis]|uniref:Sugar O-acetyltransferase n=1 Tax=Litorilituus sediminis TaxID=718192 RepID=A0A4P6PBE6_9GAMM|nr:sugar O-acetyltransferase [Litorilituus sediminis]QBG37649.1 sugar O-acetyltransferase [Litorilituus sediminis]
MTDKRRFNSLTADLINQRNLVHETCRQFSRSPSKGNLKRLKALFSSCGEQVYIESGFYCDYGDAITIGDRSYINANCTIIDGAAASNKEAIGAVTIGQDCLIGPNVQFLAVSHDIEPQARRANKFNYVGDITLADNVWLGGGVIVLAGVSIGQNSVVGAGSVVTKSIPENSFYAGNPAQFIRTV